MTELSTLRYLLVKAYIFPTLTGGWRATIPELHGGRAAQVAHDIDKESTSCQLYGVESWAWRAASQGRAQSFVEGGRGGYRMLSTRSAVRATPPVHKKRGRGHDPLPASDNQSDGAPFNPFLPPRRLMWTGRDNKTGGIAHYLLPFSH